MSLFEQWNELSAQKRTEEEENAFWNKYLKDEQMFYAKVLSEKMQVISGKVSDLAIQFNINIVTFMGFLEGVNESIEIPLELENITEESEISINIIYEKLYYNMLGAKANWLYELTEWDEILSTEKRVEIKKQFNKEHTAVSDKIGRNSICVCGSGKKYKKCCMNKN